MTDDPVTPQAYNSAAPWTSPDLDQVAAALVAALGELEDVPRDQTASMGTYSYRYAGLGSVLSAVRPVLARHGLAVMQTPTVNDEGDAVVVTTIWHTSGQWLSAPPLRLAAGNTAQQVGSAITYARRYSLLAVLGMATEDDDGAAASQRQRLPAARVTRFRQAAGNHGLTEDDVRVIVHDATGGRTDAIGDVYADELVALQQAFNAHTATDATTPSATPDEPQTNEVDPEPVTVP